MSIPSITHACKFLLDVCVQCFLPPLLPIWKDVERWKMLYFRMVRRDVFNNLRAGFQKVAPTALGNKSLQYWFFGDASQAKRSHVWYIGCDITSFRTIQLCNACIHRTANIWIWIEGSAFYKLLIEFFKFRKALHGLKTRSTVRVILVSFLRLIYACVTSFYLHL